ncbi:hypothetical protein HPSA50_1458 [Helicobacter pylori SouthAfrica50]|uniref:Uncharacterized protein n=1 Tax=Helicobacter pylori SouthAfrica50 TaxID=1352357 RepID=T2S8Y0_HELPX|nr:hypothetical protein HPSA50_1458 [Helicobacter pylori SouthAfrica50]
MCSKKIRNLILCLSLVLSLHAEENTENMTEANTTEENISKDAPILLEEKRAQTLELNEEKKKLQRALMKKACLKKSIRKNANFTCSKGNCMKKMKLFYSSKWLKQRAVFL